MAQLDQELVRVTALQVVFDLLLKFGLEAFKVNTTVPELDINEPSTVSEQDKSGTEDDEEEAETEEGEAENEKDDEHDEIPAPDTDTAASVLTILTGILESEVLLTSLQMSSTSVPVDTYSTSQNILHFRTSFQPPSQSSSEISNLTSPVNIALGSKPPSDHSDSANRPVDEVAYVLF